MKLSFLGATGTVTGSKYLLELKGKKILVDCGLFQGLKELRLRNWSSLPIKAAEIDAVILTHAHLDHSGYIPLLWKQGFRGPIYCTEASLDLCRILLPDSGHLQEEDALHANRHKYSKHNPALALYTEQDAIESLKQFKALNYHTTYNIDGKIFFDFTPVGHILGASYVYIEDGNSSIIFSGDIGRFNDPIMKEPDPLKSSQYLVLESTYGNRLHDRSNVEAQLAKIINDTSAKGGSTIIPAFAVGRAQTILYHLYNLRSQNLIPEIPIYVDSPMSQSATEIFCKHFQLHKLDQNKSLQVCNIAQYTQSIEESKAIDNSNFPSIIISASGMASGGRVLHHIKAFADDHRSTILFTGFQAEGTRGRRLVEGETSIKIHGQNYQIKARIENLKGLSAHADYQEILKWLSSSGSNPRTVFVTHGEPDAAETLAQKIKDKLKWDTIVPRYLESFGV